MGGLASTGQPGRSPLNAPVDVQERRARKILFLTDVVGGGTGKHLLPMLGHWNPSLWSAEIVSQARPATAIHSTVPIRFMPPPGGLDRYPIGQIRRLMRLRRQVTEDPPDLIHSYFLWSIIYGRCLKRLGKVRFLVENREDQGFNWGKQEYALLRLTRSLPDRVICVSEAVRQVVLEREGLDPACTLVVHNGVEPLRDGVVDGSSVRKELGLTDENLVVGMVANFNLPVKGVPYFLDAIPLIVEAVPSARFVLLGRGVQEEALRAKAAKLGVEPYVIFAGYREEVEAFYAAMDVSVLTSLSEGLSITLLESMRQALPIVATRVGGNPEVVVEGQTGYLVEPRDTPAFAARVVELLQNDQLRLRMGRAGRDRITKHFQIDSAARRYLQIYEECFGERAAPDQMP